MPDIVLFVSVLLKGIYEVALQYGFDYDFREERYSILKLMDTSMRRGTDQAAEEEAGILKIIFGKKAVRIELRFDSEGFLF